MDIKKIYDQFDRELYHYILGQVKNPEETKEILQEVYLKIINNINSLKSEDKLRYWIFSITHNAIIDYYRKIKKVNNKFTELPADALAEESDPDNLKGLEKCVTLFIDNLPTDYKEIITEVELKGVKQKDLADKYNTSYVTMRSKVQRGRERIKNMILDCCNVELDCRGNIKDYTQKNTCYDC